MDIRHTNSASATALILAMAALTAMGGCQLFGRDEVPVPPSYSRQSAEIHKLVELDDPQQNVIEKLERAGMTGEYSRHGNSVYYCQIWNRSDGEIWQMSVMLQFQKGIRFAIVPYDADWGHDRARDDRRPKTTGFPRTDTTDPGQGAGQPFPWPTSTQQPQPDHPHDSRIGHRTPFATP